MIPSGRSMLISGLWGLAAYAVEGSAATDFFVVDLTAQKLDMLGRLLGSVRLLDMVLTDDRQVQWYSEQFFKGNYTFRIPGEGK